MAKHINKNSWLGVLIDAYNKLGGTAKYQSIYPVAKRIRLSRGGSWTAKSDATIRRTVEDNSLDSKNFRGRKVFYSVKGIGHGAWGLEREYLVDAPTTDLTEQPQSAYLEGIEGILIEQNYLRRSRDPKLVEQRKIKDDFTCQVCGYRKEVEQNRYIIDVHHLNPVGSMREANVTSIDDLICLCPNCHRIAHSGANAPLSLLQIAKFL